MLYIPFPLKRCSSCRAYKSWQNFQRNRANADGLQKRCRACQNIANHASYEKHGEKTKARQRTYAHEHAAERYARNRKYIEEHREWSRAYHREWRRQWRQNPTSRHIQSERFSRWRSKNKDRLNRYGRDWRKAHPDKVLEASRLRRARKLQVGGQYTKSDELAQYKRQHGKCYWCDKDVGDTYHVDHVVPLTRGGSNGPENIVIACPFCNMSKNDKLPHEWSGSNGKLL